MLTPVHMASMHTRGHAQVHSHLQSINGQRTPIKGEPDEFSMEVVKYSSESRHRGAHVCMTTC